MRSLAMTLRTVPATGYLLGATLATLSVASWIVSGRTSMPMVGTFDVWALVLFTVIWAIGMVAMMFPSLIPMTYMISVSTGSNAENLRGISTRISGPALFVLGYVGVWSLIGVTFYLFIVSLAALRQPVNLGQLSLVGGAILVATGLYQFTRFKQNALMKCRSPVGFIMTCWRAGRIGSLIMGGDYGLFCSKCCWVLMAGLLLVGAMSLPLMGVFSIIIFAEKIGRYGPIISKLVGAAFVAAGVFLIL